MRTAVFAICALYLVGVIAIWIGTVTASGMDNMSRGMSLGFLIVGAGIAAVFVIPAAILAAMDKALPWALGLSLVPVVLLLITGGF